MRRKRKEIVFIPARRRGGRRVVVAMYVIVAAVVVATFILRLPRSSILLTASADNVGFTLWSRLGVEWPSSYRLPQLYSGPRFWDNGDSIAYLGPYLVARGSGILVGLTAHYSLLQPEFHAWGSGRAHVSYNQISFAPDSLHRWLFRGIPVFEAGDRRIVSTGSLNVTHLGFYSVTGAALAAQYALQPQDLLDSTAYDDFRAHSTVHAARIEFPDLPGEVRLIPRGDPLWLEGDSGQIRALVITDTGAVVTYSGGTRGMVTARNGRQVNLMPTFYDWIAHQPLAAVGVGLIITIGGLIFASYKWWHEGSGSNGNDQKD